jgi:hypothetical protein
MQNTVRVFGIQPLGNCGGGVVCRGEEFDCVGEPGEDEHYVLLPSEDDSKKGTSHKKGSAVKARMNFHGFSA